MAAVFASLLLLLQLSLTHAEDPQELQSHNASDRKNIVFVLTDDQDMVLGGLTPMPKLKELVIDEGMLFTNAFVTTPICCPSRSSILTGKYIHNHGAHNNSVAGNCAGTDWLANNERKTMATYLKSLGYRTMFAGKYLNQYGTPQSPSTVSHVPPGWDSWLGLVGNSQYYDYSVSDNGVRVHHGDDYASDYFTDVIANRSYEFLANTTRDHPGVPFFMYLATPASHGPDTAAPQYNELFPNATAPRTPNFNAWGARKHWLMRYQIPMTWGQQQATDNLLRKRWRTLVSVDNMVANLVGELTRLDRIEDTYIVFFSDNGYHLGQFCFGADKRQPYETDIRVPMAVRGPGIPRGVVEESIALNIDLMPTFVDLAGGATPESADGISLKPTLMQQTNATRRQFFLVDYYGEGGSTCDLYGKNPCAIQRRGYDQLKGAGDARNNTYHCVRQLVTPQTKESLTRMYCEFEDDESFVELYEMKADPWQMENRAYSNSTQDMDIARFMKQKLSELRNCSGASCRVG